MRLSEDELKIYERNKWNIYMTRGVLGILFQCIIFSKAFLVALYYLYCGGSFHYIFYIIV